MAKLHDHMDDERGHGGGIETIILEALEEEDIITRLSAGDMDAVRDLGAAAEEFDKNWRDYDGPNGHELKALANLVEATTHEVGNLMRQGDHAEAARRVRLITEPKWHSLAACDAAYGVAMGRVYGPPDQRSAIDRLHGELASLPMFAPPSCQPHASER